MFIIHKKVEKFSKNFQEFSVINFNVYCRGNVLVHCEQGHRRSPSIFLSWMVTLPGYNISKAIQSFSSGYKGKSKKDWGKIYQQDR